MPSLTVPSESLWYGHLTIIVLIWIGQYIVKKKNNKKRALTQCGPATPYGDTKCATLAQLMVCGLSQCRLIISEVLWHSPEGNVTGYATDIYPCNGVGIVSLRLQPNLPRANQPINNQWHWYCVILVLLFEVTQSWSDIRTRTNRDQITKHAPNMATCQNYLRRSQNEPIMYRVINTGIKTNYWYLFAISKKKCRLMKNPLNGKYQYSETNWYLFAISKTWRLMKFLLNESIFWNDGAISPLNYRGHWYYWFMDLSYANSSISLLKQLTWVNRDSATLASWI